MNDASPEPESKRLSSSKPSVVDQSDETAGRKRSVTGDVLVSAAEAFAKTPMERWLIENRHQEDGITNEKGSVLFIFSSSSICSGLFRSHLH